MNLRKCQEGLSSFFRKTWADSSGDVCQYRVYMAQKCLNLNEGCFRQAIGGGDCPEGERERLEKVRNETFLSQYALLLRSDEWIDCYEARGDFPRLLLVDELSMTGHDYASLMYRMLDALRQAWESRHGEMDQEQYRAMRERFAASVRCEVYACGEEKLLLDPSLYSAGDENGHLSCRAKPLNTPTCYQYMDCVIQILNRNETVANTAFTTTLRLSRERYEAYVHGGNPFLAGWHSSRWTYGETETDVWQKTLVGSPQCARLHMVLVCRESRDGETVSVTPYAFWGRLPEETLSSLFARLSALFLQADCAALAKICAVPYPAAANSKLRFLYALTGILVLSELTGEDISALDHDLKKIAQCFGTPAEIYPAFQTLCREESRPLRLRLRRTMERAMENAAPLWERSGPTGEDRFSQSDYLRWGEDYLIQVDYQKNKQAKHRRDEGRLFVPWSDYFLSGGRLSQYFKHFPDGCTPEGKMAALVLLAQCNVFSFTISAQDGDVIYLKAGESTSLAARYSELSLRQMAPYLPALVVLEKVCVQFRLTVENWAVEFGVFLEKRGEGRGLREIFSAFVHGAYNGGYTMEDYLKVVWTLSAGDTDLRRRQKKFQELAAEFFREN